jgi:hypothetical protein
MNDLRIEIDILILSITSKNMSHIPVSKKSSSRNIKPASFQNVAQSNTQDNFVNIV